MTWLPGSTVPGLSKGTTNTLTVPATTPFNANRKTNPRACTSNGNPFAARKHTVAKGAGFKGGIRRKDKISTMHTRQLTRQASIVMCITVTGQSAIETCMQTHRRLKRQRRRKKSILMRINAELYHTPAGYTNVDWGTTIRARTQTRAARPRLRTVTLGNDKAKKSHDPQTSHALAGHWEVKSRLTDNYFLMRRAKRVALSLFVVVF